MALTLRMKQLRDRLTNVSPKGQRCSVDQNTLKRTDLGDFVSCYFGVTSAVSSKKAGVNDPSYNGNRHERRETDRFKSFTYEELLKRDKVNVAILTPRFPTRRPLGPPVSFFAPSEFRSGLL